MFAHSKWDALPAAAALAHGAALAALGEHAALVAVGVWWTSNAVAHPFLHRPFFRPAALNAAFAVYLTALLGYSHSWWREAHLLHHAGRDRAPRWTRRMALEAALVLAVWGAFAAADARWFLAVYLPGWAVGMLLCLLQGRYEHAGGRDGGISYYGALYNLLLFRDGYHAEHHRRPGAHWTSLRREDLAASAWPPLLRWMEDATAAVLGLLERLALALGPVRGFVLHRHGRAMGALLEDAGPIRRVAIVGGGLFPRSAILLRRLLPDAELTIIDRSAASIRRARREIDAEFVEETYDPARGSYDLVVVPLSYVGDRAALYRDPPAPYVLIHDWIWRPAPEGRVISWLMLKRLNLVRAVSRAASTPQPALSLSSSSPRS